MPRDSVYSSTSVLLRRIDQFLRHLITFALRQRVTSYSAVNAIPTGNAYQSVRLRGDVLPGFRKGRSDLFAGIPLDGRKVFDIGCNLGENCRLMREHGAAFVDGIEHEKLFVRIGQLINVYNDLGRISIRQGDASDEGEYQEPYDIVFALSVFPYIKNRIKNIANITKWLFFLETHKLNDNWIDVYVKPILESFKYMGIICATDWGINLDVKERRLLLVFSNQGIAIPDFVGRRAAALKNTDCLVTVDLRRSEWYFAKAPIEFFGKGTDLQSAIQAAEGWLERHNWPLGDQDRLNIAEIGYWAAFLYGYKQYITRQMQVDNRNFYVKYLKSGLEAGAGDQSLVRRDLTVVASRRFRDLFQLQTCGPDVTVGDPIVLYNCSSSPQYGRDKVVEISGPSYYALALDGYHRVFSSIISGIDKAPAMRFWYSHHPVALNHKLDKDIEAVLSNVVV